MGAILLEGATIEEDCLIGAGALVSPGKIIPRGSLALGVPAKVKRAVEQKEIDNIKKNAQDYISLAEAHRRTSHLL
jgi:carbonic anhydrase/acetyltransferase-like protein (isoleucine patch superfamily)